MRERLNAYIEIARRVVEHAEEATASQLLQTEAARGPLTVWSTGQIEKLLEEIDVYRYMRYQPICERLPDGGWKRLYEECYIGFEALRLERFPKLDPDPSSHLFLALCEALDHSLLRQLTDHPVQIEGKQIFLNVSVGTILGGGFAAFTRNIPRARRGDIGFELHRGDIFQDFDMTLSAIAILRQEGYKISLDSVSPNLLPYLNLPKLDIDYIKLNVAKDRAAQLHEPAVQAALAEMPKDKIIFFRCDSESALMAGLALGIKRFQGWLIDDYLHVAMQ